MPIIYCVDIKRLSDEVKNLWQICFRMHYMCSFLLFWVVGYCRLQVILCEFMSSDAMISWILAANITSKFKNFAT